MNKKNVQNKKIKLVPVYIPGKGLKMVEPEKRDETLKKIETQKEEIINRVRNRIRRMNSPEGEVKPVGKHKKNWVGKPKKKQAV